MSLFGGILGGLFGGSSTKVNNTNTTTVENNVSVDLSGVASALQAMGQMFGANQQVANKALTEQEALLLVQAAQQQQTNAQLGTANKTFKQLAYGLLVMGSVWLLWRK